MTIATNDNPAALGATPAAYDRPTIVLHWLTAALVLLQWGGAISMGLVDERPIRMIYWTVHIELGTTLFCVILARLAWRRMGGRVLPSVGSDVLQKAAKATHHLLYTLIVVLILLGFVIVALRGWSLIGLFKITPIMPGYHALSSTLIGVHKWTAHVLMAVALGHALVALYHHRVLKDGVLRRMTGG